MKKTDFLKNKLISFFLIILSVLSILLFWQIGSIFVDSSLILPAPIIVAKEIIRLLYSFDFWNHLIFTLSRIFFAFFISVILGFVIGFICGKNNYINVFFKAPLSLIRICPVISIILMVIYCFTSNTIPIFVAVLMTIPSMIDSIQKSLLEKDQKLYDMAKIYNFSILKKIIYLDLFTVKNAFWSSVITIFGMSWKVVVAGEVLSIPEFGLGSILQKNSVHLNTETVFAITLLLVFFSFVIEMFFSLLIKHLFIQRRNNK